MNALNSCSDRHQLLTKDDEGVWSYNHVCISGPFKQTIIQWERKLSRCILWPYCIRFLKIEIR